MVLAFLQRPVERLLSLRVSEEALQGLDALLAPLGDVQEEDACRPEATPVSRILDVGSAHFVPRDGIQAVGYVPI